MGEAIERLEKLRGRVVARIKNSRQRCQTFKTVWAQPTLKLVELGVIVYKKNQEESAAVVYREEDFIFTPI